jgi:hypothetical protein
LGANAGISYYGIYRDTILPYVLALLGSAYFSIKVAEQYSSSETAIIKYAFLVMGLLTIGIMITPDSLSNFMDELHRAFGSCLFGLQLLFSSWLVVRSGYNLWLIAGTLLELAAGIAAYVYLAPQNGLLLQSQVVFQAAFAGVAMYALSRPAFGPSLVAETPKRTGFD